MKTFLDDITRSVQDFYEAEIPERLRKHVEEAVRLCPRQALRLEG